MCELVVATADDGMELVLDAPRHGAGLADEVVVDFADRHDLGRRAGEEQLVREHQVAARESTLTDIQAQARGDLHDAVAGDTLEDAVTGRRRHQSTATHGEDVLARTLGHVPALVEHDRLVVARVGDLDLGEDAVEVLAGGLGGARQR